MGWTYNSLKLQFFNHINVDIKELYLLRIIETG